ASILLTVAAAGAATALGLLGGVPLAWLLARRRFPGRRLVEALLDLPVVVPHPVAGIALLLFLGRESTVGGALARAGLEVVSHVPGIVAAMLFVSVPLLVSAAREGFAAVDPRLERVARTLGDGPAAAFRRVTLPLAGRAILAGAVLAWARSVSEFGAVVVLTYNPKVGSILAFDRFTTGGLSAAVPVAVLLLGVALVVTAVARLLVREREA
ncbi:MAG TPA: ABC transporter permease, partial [Gemmatimonadales bacterium]|nr:ABC transporter permease [Gemmatimonadales bacterium]